MNKECQKCLEDRNRLYLEYLQTFNQLLEVQNMNKVKLGVKKCNEKALIPNYQTNGASGFDLHSVEYGIIYPHQSALIKTGLCFEIPKGYEVQVRSRSGLAAKNGIQAHFGTIDSDYRGEVGVILFNHSDEPFRFNEGDRIAQAVIVPLNQALIFEVETLTESERGTNGFGSTGLNSNKPL